MKKIITIAARILLALLLVSPILGTLGIFPEPTADLYNTSQAFTFITTLMDANYIMYIMSGVFLISIILIAMNRMAAVAILILPITLNIIGFHAFLDGGLFTAGAIMGNVLFLLNVYFLWITRDQITPLFQAKK